MIRGHMREIASRALATSIHFRALSGAARDRLLDAADLESFPQRRRIAGSVPAMWILIEGSMKVSFPGPHGERIPISVLARGTHFNATAMFDVPASLLVAEVAAGTVCILLRQRVLRGLRNSEDEIRAFVAKLSVARMTTMIRLYRDLLDAPLPVRLARRLLAQVPAHVAGDGRAVDLELTQSTLAQMLRTSRPRLNQVLKGMQRSGAVEVGYRRILLADPAALRRLAGPAVHSL